MTPYLSFYLIWGQRYNIFLYFIIALAAILKNAIFKNVPLIFQRFIGAKFHLNKFYLPNPLTNKGSERMVTKPPNMTLLNASIIGVRRSAHLERLRIGIWSLTVTNRKTSRKKEKTSSNMLIIIRNIFQRCISKINVIVEC